MVKNMSIKIRDLRSRQFFQVDDQYLNGYAKLCGIVATGVYLSLCRHADKSQKCFPSKRLIAEELNISERAVYDAMKKLEEWQIVTTEEQGRKADGSFRNRIYTLLDKEMWKEKPQATGAVGRKQQSPQATGADARRHVVPNKDTHMKDTHKMKDTHLAPPGGASDEIAYMIDLFKEVNPSYKILFGRKNQRDAVVRLLEQYGRDDLEAKIKALPKIISFPYAPKPITPLELERDMGKIKAFAEQKRNQTQTKVEQNKSKVAII